MYTLLVKVFNSSKFDNQRSAQVLTNTSEEVPDFINWHKNYAKACGLKNGRCYIITVQKEQNDAGYDNFTIKNSLELGKLSQLKKKHLNGCFSFSLSNPKLKLNSVLASVYMVLNGSLLVRLKKEKYLGLKSLGGLAYVRTTHYSFLFPSSFLTLNLIR